MFNPAAAMNAVKAVLTKNPKLLEEWASKADTDVEGVRQEVLKLAADNGVKLSAGQLKMALAAAKPFLGKLNATSKAAAEKLIKVL